MCSVCRSLATPGVYFNETHCIIQIYFIPDNFVERNYVFPPLISLSLCLSVCLFVCMMSQKVPVEFRLNYTSVRCRYCLNLAQLTRRGVMKRFFRESNSAESEVPLSNILHPGSPDRHI